MTNWPSLAVTDRHVGIYASPDNWRTCVIFGLLYSLGLLPEIKHSILFVMHYNMLCNNMCRWPFITCYDNSK